MVLAHPGWLWLGVPWSFLAAWAAWGVRRRVRAWRAAGQDGKPPGDGATGGLAASLLLIVALAQPRWGIDPATALPPGRDVVFLIDVSRSMGAEDAVPNRLGVAIESAEGLIAAMAREDGDRVAVVAFAGGGVVRCGLTENLGAAVEVVRSLRPGTVQPGGTDLGAALETAAGAFDDRDHADGRMIVVFTDGEDLAGGWRARVEPLKAAGIVVNAVAIGDPDSASPVPSGLGSLVLSYRGKPVVSKRSDEALDALANATGGSVVPLGLASADLGALYRVRIAPAARRQRDATRPPERAERFGLFILAALLVLPIGAGSRRARRTTPRWRTFAALSIVVLFGAGPEGDSAREKVERGRLAYQAGLYHDALGLFKAAAEGAPESAIPRFDAGAALYALGRYPEAIARYREARARGDVSLRIKADYALGNALLMAGDPASAIPYYDACIASTRRSAALDAVRRDAEANRVYARHRIEKEPPPPAPSTEPDLANPKQDPADSKADLDRNHRPDDQAPRGQGGAGGSQPDPRPASERGSPGDRLDAALDRLREALRNRVPDAPARAASVDLKDW